MSRLRRFAAAACLFAALMAAMPAVGLASRSAERDSPATLSEPQGSGLVGAMVAWGQGALNWFQALIAAEHGQIIPLAPPPPPPPPPPPFNATP